MKEFANGMSATKLTDLGVAWVKSEMSGAVGDCVELASLPNGEVAVRNSRFPNGEALIFTKSEIAAFIDGAKKDEFKNLH